MESTDGGQEVGGAFQTGLIAGVTHSIHVANVGFNQQLTIIASAAAQYATINGVQIVPLTGLAGGFEQADGDQYGRAVACIGDIDGDDADDFVVGAPYNDDAGANAGKVFVYSGLTQEIIHSIEGEAAGDQFGYALAGAGDVNADGTPDFIVGAPFSDQSEIDAGKVYVYSGVDFTVIYSKVGSISADRFGQAVVGGVDVNDDGHDDFFVGAPESKSKDGQVYVFSGATGQKLKVLKGDDGDKLGWSIAPLPKANSDSYADFAVSSPLNDDAGSSAGKVTVYSGKDFTALYDLLGENPGDQFGLSIACARRANEDGRDDLIIGSPYYDASGKSNRGRIEAFSGKDGDLLWTKTGSTAGDRLGAVVAGVGDVNGDGRDDIAASATYHDGAGTDAGRVQVRSGLNGSSIANINGEAVGDRFALALAGLQNPSGNGSNSVLAGAPRNDFYGLSSGKVYVVSFIDAAQAPSPDDSGQLSPIQQDLGPVAKQSNNSSKLGTGFCPGDLNLDSVVDDADLLALIQFWGACDLCPEDLNGDDAVDSADLIMLVNAWGDCS